MQARNNNKQQQGQPFLSLAIFCTILSFAVRYADADRFAFVSPPPPTRGIATSSQTFSASDDETADAKGTDGCSIHSSRLATASGKPVCRYALGGAARSTQPESLPLRYRDSLSRHDAGRRAAPFYFYYNPHRYPAFLSGVARSHAEEGGGHREDAFFASGGTERSPASLDERLSDALVYSGGDYLDAFVLEYVCPYEMAADGGPGEDLERAIEHAHALKEEGKIRYVMASTHSHAVGGALASATLPSRPGAPAFDALMLRYSMSHKNAAESLSFEKALENDVPVLAFTTTRWNRLQSDPPLGTSACADGPPLLPATSDCLKFALHHPAVEAVLHSARDEGELDEALSPLLSHSSASSSGRSRSWLSEDECERWRAYGNDESRWNEDDSFDEYPEESAR